MLVDLTHHPWPLLLQVPVRLVVTGGLKKACPDVTEVKLDLNGDAGYAQRKIAKTANLEDREVGGLSIRHVGLNKMLDTAPESLASIGDIGVDGTTLLEVRHAGADRKAAEDCFKKLNACPLIVQNLSGDNSQLLSEWQTSTDLARDLSVLTPRAICSRRRSCWWPTRLPRASTHMPKSVNMSSSPPSLAGCKRAI